MRLGTFEHAYYIYFGVAHSMTVIVIGKELGTRVQILNEFVALLIARIHLTKAWIQLFWADWAFQLGMAAGIGEGKC